MVRDTPAEFELQAAKIVTAITEMDADVIGLMEIENNFGAANDAALDLVDAAQRRGRRRALRGDRLDAPVGTDAISNAMIYQPASVTPVGAPALADHQAFVNPLGASIDATVPRSPRPSRSTGGDGSSRPSTTSSPRGRRAARGPGDHARRQLQPTRGTMAAEEMVRWLAEGDPTGTGARQDRHLGDLNSYAMEDPIEALRDAGYVDALGDRTRCRPTPTSSTASSVDSTTGSSSATLADHLVDAAEWHINADEPSAFDYNDWNDPAHARTTSEFRSSDHDPLHHRSAVRCAAAENQPPTVEDLEHADSQEPVRGRPDRRR